MPRTPRINLIIAGKLIPNWISRFEFLRLHLNAIYSLDRGVNKRFSSMLGAGIPRNCWDDLDSASTLLISVPDERLLEMLRGLQDARSCWKGTTILLSDSQHDSTLLNPLRRAGAKVATLNQLTAFEDGRFIYEGDADACDEIRELLSDSVKKLYPITTEGKTLFLAGINFASQISFATFAASADLMRRAGVPVADATLVTERLFTLSGRSYGKGGRQRWNKVEGLRQLDELQQQWLTVKQHDPVLAQYFMECVQLALATLTSGEAALPAMVRREPHLVEPRVAKARAAG